MNITERWLADVAKVADVAAPRARTHEQGHEEKDQQKQQDNPKMHTKEKEK
jgi:hypothetical protein